MLRQRSIFSQKFWKSYFLFHGVFSKFTDDLKTWLHVGKQTYIYILKKFKNGFMHIKFINSLSTPKQ